MINLLFDIPAEPFPKPAAGGLGLIIGIVAVVAVVAAVVCVILVKKRKIK